MKRVLKRDDLVLLRIDRAAGAHDVAETLRSLLAGTGAGSTAWTAVAWCAGILAVSIAVAGVVFRRKTA
jgi:hypothetical protein